MPREIITIQAGQCGNQSNIFQFYFSWSLILEATLQITRNQSLRNS